MTKRPAALRSSARRACKKGRGREEETDDEEVGEDDISAIRVVDRGGDGDGTNRRGEDAADSEEEVPEEVEEEQVNLAQLARLARIRKRMQETDYAALDDLTLMEGENFSQGQTSKVSQSAEVRGTEGEGELIEIDVDKRAGGDGRSDNDEFFDGEPLTNSQIL